MENLKKDQMLGNFKILELISSGGMGAVYKACHKNNPKEIFALKVIRSEFCSDTGFVSRFKQEEGLIINLSHQNIVKGFHFGVTPEGEHYFVMEYVEGEDLRARLTREKRLSVGDTLNIAVQVCSALKYAHGEGVIHRDIKPENILLKPDGTALLADFGIMKMVGEGTYHKTVTSLSRMNSGGGDSMEGRASLGRLSSAGGEEEGRQSSAGGAARKGPSPGTLSYMAPEQISGDAITARTDIYQLGVVMYECLTGELPLGRFEDPSALNPAIVPYLERTILKCLKAKAATRYGSAGELGQVLEALGGKVEDKPRSPVLSQPPAEESHAAAPVIQPKPEPGLEMKVAISKPEPTIEIKTAAPKPEPSKSQSTKFWLILIFAGLLPVSIIALWLFSGNRLQSDASLDVKPFTAKDGGTELNINDRSSPVNQPKILNPGKSQSDSVPRSTRQQQQGSSLDIFKETNKGLLGDGYDKDGYDEYGYNKAGYNRYGYDRNGYDRNGYDKDGYYRNGYNKDGYRKDGYDKDGYDRIGYDKGGYDRNGYNKGGYDKGGYDRNGNKKKPCDKGYCNWDDAVVYCKSRGSRLPTVTELKKMSQAECASVKRTAACHNSYWSSEEGRAGHALTVHFIAGDVQGIFKYCERGNEDEHSGHIYVRCAR